MLNRDKPLGQRRHDGYFFGNPWSPRPRRAEPYTSVTRHREQFGWLDRAGMPHGRSGDKLRRKAISGTVGIRSGTRGPLASMLIVRKGKFPFSSTKR